MRNRQCSFKNKNRLFFLLKKLLMPATTKRPGIIPGRFCFLRKCLEKDCIIYIIKFELGVSTVRIKLRK